MGSVLAGVPQNTELFRSGSTVTASAWVQDNFFSVFPLVLIFFIPLKPTCILPLKDLRLLLGLAVDT